MFKTKSGELITWKEFFKRFKNGIASITPLQKISNELISSIISLIGSVICLVALIIFNDKFIVSWFAYGLLLIFLGTIGSNGVKVIGLFQQKKIFKLIEKQMNMPNEVDKLEEIK